MQETSLMKPPLSTRGFKVRPKGDAKCRDIVWKSKNMVFKQKKTQEIFKSTQATAVLRVVAAQLAL